MNTDEQLIDLVREYPCLYDVKNLSTEAPTRDDMSGTLNVCEELNVNGMLRYVTLRYVDRSRFQKIRYVTCSV